MKSKESKRRCSYEPAQGQYRPEKSYGFGCQCLVNRGSLFMVMQMKEENHICGKFYLFLGVITSAILLLTNLYHDQMSPGIDFPLG